MLPQFSVQLLRGAVFALEDISAQWKVADETCVQLLIITAAISSSFFLNANLHIHPPTCIICFKAAMHKYISIRVQYSGNELPKFLIQIC